MIAGKVVGSVISTRKCENLVGNKFMIVDVLDHMQTSGKQLIAIDKIGAGIGMIGALSSAQLPILHLLLYLKSHKPLISFCVFSPATLSVIQTNLQT